MSSGLYTETKLHTQPFKARFNRTAGSDLPTLVDLFTPTAKTGVSWVLDSVWTGANIILHIEVPYSGSQRSRMMANSQTARSGIT